nr:MAG TPA: hypothetical protein [Caudoviricetes sp.]
MYFLCEIVVRLLEKWRCDSRQVIRPPIKSICVKTPVNFILT